MPTPIPPCCTQAASLVVVLIAAAQAATGGMFVGHFLFLTRFGSCNPGLMALRQGVEGLELVALLQPALLAL